MATPAQTRRAVPFSNGRSSTALASNQAHSESESIEVASERLRRDTARLHKQFDAWDSLVVTSGFLEFLEDRRLLLVPQQPDSLPFDMDAEQAVLGAMLLAEPQGDMEAVPTAVELLRPDMFYHSIHRSVFGAVCKLHDRRSRGAHRHLRIDMVTVGTHLRREGLLESVGGTIPAEYLTQLHFQCPSTANVVAYIDPVVETYKLRTLWAAGCELTRLSVGPEADSEHLLVAMQNIAGSLREFGFCDVGALLQPNK